LKARLGLVTPGRISPEPEDRRPIRGAPPDWDDRGIDWEEKAMGGAGAARDEAAFSVSLTDIDGAWAYTGGLAGETDLGATVCLGFDESVMMDGAAS
jgi:hypothetical protein